MIKFGVNTVLFKTVDFATAAKYLKKAGYDGVGICALRGPFLAQLYKLTEQFLYRPNVVFPELGYCFVIGL